MIIVVRVRPSLFYRNPYNHLFDLCLNNQFSSFRTSLLAEQFIRKQQILARQHFIMMAFSHFLRTDLVQSNRDLFFSHLDEMRYYAPSSRQTGRNLAVRRDYSLDQEDREFVRAQSLSMMPQPPRPSSTRRVVPEGDVTAQKTLPQNFKLASEIATQIKNNQYNDPITLENINDSTEVSCVRLPNGFYNIYDKNSLSQLIQANGRNGSFKDPLSNSSIKISDVFSVPTSLVKSFANGPTAAPARDVQDEEATQVPRKSSRSA